jgi:DEAD/DEAH box helicase domain-containing protein
MLGRHPQATSNNILHYIGHKDNPAQQISLRAIDPERFSIVNEADGGAVLEEIEESKAFFEVYDGAVYMYQVQTPGHAVFLHTSILFCFLPQIPSYLLQISPLNV